MAAHPRILHVSTADTLGGAEKVAWSLFQAARARGYPSWMAVGYKFSDDPDVLLLPKCRSHDLRARLCWSLHALAQRLLPRARPARRLERLVHYAAAPRSLLDRYRGVEDFNYPGTWSLLELPPQRPDVVHCHNLHGAYFDLRALPWLARQVPTMITLHDAWLLSGHCAHSFDCDRWKIGCGQCPDLTIYPAIRRDATAYNWRRKRALYAQSRLYIATPCRWLMQKVEQSMLASAIVDARVINNGVDLRTFRPAERPAVRNRLGLPAGAHILLFAANGIRRNPWKDYQTMRAAVALLADRLDGTRVLFVALGESGPPERIGQAEVRFVPYQPDPAAVAAYYQAADVYVHAARADTFPTTVLEALACGTPVVATAVGGIPEQVEDGQTGYLTPAGDAAAMAAAIARILSSSETRQFMSARAAETARSRFNLERQVDAYLEWYIELLTANQSVKA